jgi:hypothetical protein
MTYEEMVLYLVGIAETYPPNDYNGEELLDYIVAEINALEARGVITTEVRDRLYRHFGVTTPGHGGPG